MTDSSILFPKAFENLTGHPPFPWQEKLYNDWFLRGKVPSSCNLPTGLGKTNVIAVWLIARANGANVPRRLVYVVNRRTVVDQTTNEAIKLRDNARKIGIDNLAISTLRGQFADNREWSADPSRPAIICGTVDMIGSRLLFSGYGVGFKSRPLHAGFLGQDALLVHDEAHLEPAFQRLITDIEREQTRERERGGDVPWPKLRVMQLTATTRDGGRQTDEPFQLTDEEKNPPNELPNPPVEPIHHVWQRLRAKKTMALHPVDNGKDAVAKEIARLATVYRDSNAAVLVFVRTLDEVGTIEKELAKTKREVVLLTGTLRGKERDGLVEQSEFKRFFKDAQPGETVYLVCTSAGEVGIDVSADHLVCDLSTFESMTQRFGRVNRYGDGNAQIDVVYPTKFDDKDRLKDAREATLRLLQELNGNASPLNLGRLDPKKRAAAFTPEPTILRATDILFDTWSMTTIREKLPGRPPIQAYLHGVEDERSVETHIAWRREVWECRRDFTDEEDRLHFQKLAGELLEDYPLKPHELLRDSTFRKSSGIRDQLIELGGRYGMLPVWIQEPEGSVIVATLSDIADLPLAGRTVILPPQAGGLVICEGHSKGLFDGGAEYQPDADDLYDVSDQWYEDSEEKIRRRIRVWDDDPQREDKTIGMRPIREVRFQTCEENEDPPGRSWLWFERPEAADNEGSQSALKPVLWQDHTNDVTANARAIVEKLSLPDDVRGAVVLAAKFHDLGKKREVWQWGIGNTDYPRVAYAKSGRKWRTRHMSGYRHEFGSLLDIQEEREFREQSDGARDLILHLVASGHGRGRPHFPTNETFDPEPKGSDGNKIAVEVVQRFARLQRRYGRWALAYVESLVRAADYAASVRPSAFLENQQEAQP